MGRERISEQFFRPSILNLIPKSSNHSSQNREKNPLLELRLDIQPYSSGSKTRLQDDVNVNVNDAMVAKKIQKADREKLRRDKLNEHFRELGNVLDSDRHKNDKASIVINAIQALKDLTSEVSRLRSEHAGLFQESNELTLENNELREEKSSLQSDIETLEAQYQQTLSFMCPWAPTDPTVVMAPPFTFPMCSPPLHPVPYFGNQSGVTFVPGSALIPYLTPATTQIEQQSTLNASASYIPSKEDFENGPSSQKETGNSQKLDDYDDVVTDLELGIPGSTSQKLFPGEKGQVTTEGESKYWRGCSSSHGSQTLR